MRAHIALDTRFIYICKDIIHCVSLNDLYDVVPRRCHNLTFSRTGKFNTKDNEKHLHQLNFSDLSTLVIIMNDIKTEIVDNTEQVSELVDWLLNCLSPSAPSFPIMYVDLEVPNLCRHGSISIFTILVDAGISTSRIYLIDIHTLGGEVFRTEGTQGKTLKDILQENRFHKSSSTFTTIQMPCTLISVCPCKGLRTFNSWKVRQGKPQNLGGS